MMKIRTIDVPSFLRGKSECKAVIINSWLEKCVFIQTLEVNTLMKGEANLVELTYFLDKFDDALFDKYSVFFPSTIKRSARKRRADFFAGRLAAKIAFFALHDVPLASQYFLSVGEHGEPLWPKDSRGSISHTDRKAVCLLTRDREKTFVGIDVENLMDKNTANEVGMIIQERSEMEILLARKLSFEFATTLLFSAKESLFKAIFPYVGKYLDFAQSQLVDIDFLSRKLTLHLCNKIAKDHQIPNSYILKFEINDSSVQTMTHFYEKDTRL